MLFRTNVRNLRTGIMTQKRSHKLTKGVEKNTAVALPKNPLVERAVRLLGGRSAGIQAVNEEQDFIELIKKGVSRNAAARKGVPDPVPWE